MTQRPASTGLPEQLAGGPASREADIFSLGIVLYGLLAGSYPFPASSAREQRLSIEDMPHVPIRKLRSDVPRKLQAITNRCLAKIPGQRYPTAMHLSAGLDVAFDVLRATATGEAKREIFKRVRKLPTFVRFSDLELKQLVLSCMLRTFKPGEEVIGKGDTADCLYVVLEGEVGVRIDVLESIHLGPGEFIGEIGVLTGSPRMATVVALDRCRLVSIPRSFLENGPLGCQLHLKDVLLKMLVARFAKSASSAEMTD